MLTHLGFQVGDYVIADHAKYDDFTGQTFKITELTANRFGEPLVKVADIARPDDSTSFYPSELSYEDGTRPNINVVNRGAW